MKSLATSPAWVWPTVHCIYGFMSVTPEAWALCAQDIKNADLALYELNRVITLEPNWPEVYEQRAEVRPNPVH